MTGQQTRAFASETAPSGQLQLSFDSDTDEQFDWDTATVVEIDHPPHEAAFDTDRFYKIPLTAARPIEQVYETVEGDRVMKKPARELRRAAWSMDNAPITLGHPSTRIVDSVGAVRGFVRQPSWDSTDEALEGNAYIPVDDDAARAYIDDHSDVSIGFWYEAETDTTEADIDAYQTDLLVDHVAIVAEGRCSREDGCGLAIDTAAVRGFHADSGIGGCSAGPCRCGFHATDKTEAREARAEYRYETREAAANAAEELDCASGDDAEAFTHSHEKDNGQTVYMPCESHGEFREQFDAHRGDEFRYDESDDESASTEGEAANIDLSESQVKSIKTIREEHDEMDTSEHSPTLGTLKKVYRRGAGAWQTSHAPGATQQQWALARVKEFLKDLRNGNALNSGADNDLAPDGYSPPSTDAAYGVTAGAVAVDKSVDEIDLVPPEAAQNAAQQALDAKADDDVTVNGMTDVGWGRAEDIASGDALSPDQIVSGTDGMANYWSRKAVQDLDTSGDRITIPVAEEHEDNPWADASYTASKGWGGVSGYKWAIRKGNEIKRARDEEPDYSRIGTDRPTEDQHRTDFAAVSFEHQTADGGVDIDMSTASAPFYVGLYADGDQHTRQNVSVGEQMGRAGPFDAHQDVSDLTVPFDSDLAVTQRVYAVLHYATESGDMGDFIESQQGLIFDTGVLVADDMAGGDRMRLRRTLREDGVGSPGATDGDAPTDVVSLTEQIVTTVDTWPALDAEGRTVAGVTFVGLRGGDLDESAIPTDEFEPHYLYPGDTKSDSSYPVVDGDGMLRRGNVDAAHSLGARGGVDEDEHASNLQALNEVFAESDDYSAPIDMDAFDTDEIRIHMSDTNTDDDMTAAIGLDSLTVDAIAEKHDGVADLREERDTLQAEVDAKDSEIESLTETLESYQADERAALVDEIMSLTAAWDEDELEDLDLDALRQRRDVAEDAAVDVSGGGAVARDSTAADAEADRSSETEYSSGDVYDLSHTA